MKLNELKPTPNSRKSSKEVGRGIGSGTGKTSTRGHKGQGSRKSGNVRIGFEGGQTPWFRRIPKRGFKNISKKEYYILNVCDLEKINLEDISVKTLVEKGIIKNHKAKNILLKILGNGEISKKITVSTHKISKSAEDKIIKAGGKVNIL